MERTVNTIKTPSVKDFFATATKFENLLDNLGGNGVIDNEDDTIFVEIGNVIEAYLSNKYIAVTVCEQREGEPLAYDFHIFDEAEAAQTFVSDSIKHGKNCRPCDVEELKRLASWEWNYPYRYSVPVDGMAALLNVEVEPK
ncbi:MAG: hypothetical protein NC299_12390 [Lachnospiraceae bacterium]|nr:hypothetical protein [Ruminococcus sp.]MCM1276140.1 hypothetical protein [Lachnospiraceae bacterium]